MLTYSITQMKAVRGYGQTFCKQDAEKTTVERSRRSVRREEVSEGEVSEKGGRLTGHDSLVHQLLPGASLLELELEHCGRREERSGE